MWLYICFLIAAATGHPLQEGAELPNINIETTTLDPEKLEKDLHVVSYVQNFKQTIAEYVTSEYNMLTVHETEEIMKVLQKFLSNFANDLKETVQNEDHTVLSEDTTTTEVVTKTPEDFLIQDGLPNETFEEIEQRIGTEFPELKHDTVKEIVYKLRKNLYETRLKIDSIILESQRSQLNIEDNERES